MGTKAGQVFRRAVTSRQFFGAGMVFFSVTYSVADAASLFSRAVPFVMICPVLLALSDLSFGFYEDEEASGSEDGYTF